MFFLLVATVAAPAPSSADPGLCRLWGEVTDGPSATPIAGAVVRVGDATATSDALGRYALSVPRNTPVVLEVYADAPGLAPEALHQSNLWFDADALYRPITLVPSARSDARPIEAGAAGVPWEGPRPTGELEPEGRAINLLEVWSALRTDSALQGHKLATLPAELPPTILIGRRFASSCSGNPVTRVDELELETYTAGVVTAEIGVFRALTAGEQASFECFKVFAIAARSYALWWWANNPTGTAWNGQYYHLDDTACNQRYDDGPYPEIILRAVEETAGMVLIDAGTSFQIDKYEYAASCGRNGCRPEHTTAIIPDDIPGVRACTGGGWCGHDNCAAHEDNPTLPGDDRCLVRGICQWGAVERSIRGDDHLAILDHYQPNLEVHPFTTAVPSPTALVGFVREASIETGSGIANARVELDTGEATTALESGYYVFEDVAPGVRTVSATAPGYMPTSGTKLVLQGIENWASLAMVPTSEPVVEPAADTALDPEDGSDSVGPDAADATPAARRSTDSGCCAQVQSRSRGPWPWALLLGLLVLGRARRRR